MPRVAVAGNFRRGKDTLADCIERVLGEPIIRLSFARALKLELVDMVSQFTHGSQEPLYEEMIVRDKTLNGPGLQWWGEYRREKFGEDYWVKRLERFFHALLNSLGGSEPWYVITDMRHHNEARWCKDNGFVRVRVAGPNRDPKDNRSLEHPSERDIPYLTVDMTYYNTGTIDNMEQWVREVLIPYVREYDGTTDNSA